MTVINTIFQFHFLLPHSALKITIDKNLIYTCVKTHKLLQVCKQVVTGLFTSCQQVVTGLFTSCQQVVTSLMALSDLLQVVLTSLIQS